VKRLLVVLACAACGSEGTAPPPPRPVARDAGPRADATAAPVDRRFVGVVVAAESVDVAPRFEGVVATVLVRAGDTVVAGQVVASMDQKSMQEALRGVEASLGAAIASKRQADVDVEDARRKLAVETRAVADGVSPSTNLDESRLGVKRAEATVQRASSTVAAESSRVQIARSHLADTSLRAPSAGTVAMRFKDPGATVAAGAPIVRVVGKAGFRLRFAVPPEQSQRLIIGAQVQVDVETFTTPLSAAIRQISPALDPASGMIIAEAELIADAEIQARLRPGLAAWVQE